MKDLIFEPSVELLDQHLREMVQLNEDYKMKYWRLKKLEHDRSTEVDEIANLKDDKGKKLYTYKNQAESHIDKSNKERTDEIHKLTTERKNMERDYKLMEMVYYHARGKLSDNRNLDVNASQMWSDVF